MIQQHIMNYAAYEPKTVHFEPEFAGKLNFYVKAVDAKYRRPGDEPTIGLHYEDVKKLIEILQKLVNKGNTVLVIEHSLDIIKSADYVIDIGPEGGEGGGQIVAKGTPEEVANNEKSYTGKYLKKALKQYRAYRKA